MDLRASGLFIQRQHLVDVRLEHGGNPAMLAHQAFPTIIGGDSQGELIVEELEKIAQVTNPSLDVLLGVERDYTPGNTGQ